MADIPHTPQPAGLDVLAKAERAREIAQQRARGLPWADIAALHSLGERQARRIYAAAIRAGATASPEHDAGAALREAVAVHREVLRDLGKVGKAADNSSARVGALRARAETARELVRLLAWAGLVPDTAGAWAFARQVRITAVGMVDAAERHGLDLAEILDDLEGVPGVKQVLGSGVGT